MIIGIHQPNFMPYSGFFNKMLNCDVFVLLDDVQFVKGGWQNRNKVKTKQGVQWLTVPVKHRFGQSINRVCIDGNNWRDRHKKMLYHSYHHCPYWYYGDDCIGDIVDVAYSKRWMYLSTFNTYLIREVAKLLGIKTDIYVASELGLPFIENNTERLLRICEGFGRDVYYLSGPSGVKYLDVAMFNKAGVEVGFQDYEPPVYAQLHGDFVAGLSIVDMLANCGPDTIRLLRGDE